MKKLFFGTRREKWSNTTEEYVRAWVVVAVWAVAVAGPIPAVFGIGWAVKQPMEWREVGDGTHTGYVTAVGKHGVFWPSWTAWFKTDAQSSQEDSYCIRLNDDLAHELRALSDSRVLVEIHYKDYLAYDWAECNGEQSVIVGVRKV